MSVWDDLSAPFKAVTVIAACVVAVLGAYTAWDNFIRQSSACSISGMAYYPISNEPAAGIALGYDNVSPQEPGQGSMSTITVTAADGSFSGNCAGVPSDAFVVVVQGGSFQGGPLPCLGARSTGIRVPADGETTGLAIAVPRC